MGETGIVELMEKCEWELLNTFNTKLINYLRYYFFVGGMPEAVLRFSQNRDWNEVRSVQNNILKAYESDFSKHAPTDILPRINLVWKSIPSQLAKENRKFFYGVVKEGARAREYEMAIQWLIDSGLLHKVYCVIKPALPLTAYRDLLNRYTNYPWHEHIRTVSRVLWCRPVNISVGCISICWRATVKPSGSNDSAFFSLKAILNRISLPSVIPGISCRL